MKSSVFPIASVILLMVFSGCGDAHPVTFPVTGVVVFDDGSPVHGGTVEFETVGQKLVSASGTISEGGRFSLGTFHETDGALPGKHRVAVIEKTNAIVSAERPKYMPQRTIHPRYGDFHTSGVIVEVQPKANTVQIIVNRPDGDEDAEEN